MQNRCRQLFTVATILITFINGDVVMQESVSNDVSSTPSPVVSVVLSDNVTSATMVTLSGENIPMGKKFEQQQSVAANHFLEQLRIEKDASDPSRLLNVFLPSEGSHHFKLFAARVIDISAVSDVRLRDANRTFSAPTVSSTIINIHSLNPGHQYSIEVLGRRDHDTTLIKEESIVMDPSPLDFATAEIRVQTRNITIIAKKPSKALQDAFRVEYIQRSPPKRFPILDVRDIDDQHSVGIYLENLSPGRDYDVSVTSLRGDLRSELWKSVITTKPLSPTNLSVDEETINSEVNGEFNFTSCIRLSWTLPTESGVDAWKIVYGEVYSQNDTQKAETTQSEIELCESLNAGREYIFAVVAVKSMQTSIPATISHVVRPLPTRHIVVRADFERGKFRIDAALPPLTRSLADHCQISVVSERGERFDQLMAVNDSNIAEPKCTAWFGLVPGRRYEISLAVLSNGASSKKFFVNKALEPGFDFDAFGLSVKENAELASVRVEWPSSEMSMLRIADLWAKIVGNDSRLHLTLSSYRSTNDNDEETQHMETMPNEAPRPLIASHLRMGACYRIDLYTVTSSGIVSKVHYEKLLRLRVPRIGLIVSSLTSHSAILNAIILKSVPLEGGDRKVLSPRVSADCVLKVTVLDANLQIVYSHILPLADGAPKIELTGLRPYFKYNVNAQTFCGIEFQQVGNNLSTPCAQKSETLDALLFETNQDRPGAVRNLSVRALSSHTLEVAWIPPALQNGVITHYMINVVPLGSTKDTASSWRYAQELMRNSSRFTQTTSSSMAVDSNDALFTQLTHGNSILDSGGFGELPVERPFSVNIPTAIDAGDIDFSVENGESILPHTGSDNAPPLVAVLESHAGASLAGGRRYRVSVVGVTMAGVGDLPHPDEMPLVDTPITEPPQPTAATGFRLDVVPGSIRADRVSVFFSTATFSAINGAIMKLALIVTQLESNNSSGADGKNRIGAVTTWAHVQSLDIWPPYVAVEFMLANGDVNYNSQRNVRPLQITQIIGAETDCHQRESADIICNGALRPASRYHIRVRLYTAPDLWTDSEPSDVIVTEALRGNVSVGGVLAALALIFFTCASLASLIFAFFCRRAHKKQRAAVKRTDSKSLESKFFDCGSCCYLSAEHPYEAHSDGAHRYIVNDISCFDVADSTTPSDCLGVYDHQQLRQDQKKINYDQRQQQSGLVGYFGIENQAANSAPRRRIEWRAWLKMIMAERAADCFAKLGLDSSAASTASYAATAAAASSSSGASSTSITTTAPGDTLTTVTLSDGVDDMSATSGWLNNGLAHTLTSNHICAGVVQPASMSISPTTMSTNAKVVTSILSAPKHQLHPLDNGLFKTHHRRSKSLRERTGVDQRLERLPSGPPAHKILLWTVVRNGGGNIGGNEKSRPVRVCDFPEHVRLMSADSDFRFSEEYEELRHIGVGQASIAADLTINRAKNRFTNILPYDHSRVKLRLSNDDEEGGSDYVNASYMPGFNSRREFIAAQGPLPFTRDHFWRMVWEQQCPAIIALTKCVEKGRDKCHQYWPDNSQRSVLYADIEVTMLNESIEYEEFTVRELRLTNLADPSQSPRTVQHLHYMAWPDFGVPDHPAGIVHFSRLFRNKLPPANTNKPTIVHCSAGVGRSGTFIALDRLYQNIELNRNIDVFGTVCEMRLERCHMVQNEQQYIFIHHCLMYVLENFFPHYIQRTPGYTATTPATPSGRNIFFGNAPPPSTSSPSGGYRFAVDTIQLNQLRSFAPPPTQPPPPRTQASTCAVSSFTSPHETPTSLSALPKIEVHHNPAFIGGDEDVDGADRLIVDDHDEGISGSSSIDSSVSPLSGTPLSIRASNQKTFSQNIFMM